MAMINICFSVLFKFMSFDLVFFSLSVFADSSGFKLISLGLFLINRKIIMEAATTHIASILNTEDKDVPLSMAPAIIFGKIAVAAAEPQAAIAMAVAR